MHPVPASIEYGEKDGSLLDLIGLLYDAATAPARWRNFLEAGARYFGAFGGNFIRYDSQRPGRSIGFLTGYGDQRLELQIDALQSFVSLRHDDPRLQFGFEHPIMPFHCRQAVSDEVLHASKCYREVLSPNGVEYSLLVTFQETMSGFTGLAFMRTSSQTMFDQDNVDDMGQLVPHLLRTIAIQDRLATLDQRTQASYCVLDALPAGIAILRQGGEVEYANAAAQDLLASGDGITLAEGRIHLARSSDERAFFAALNAVALTGAHRALHLKRPSGRTPFRGLLSYLPLVESAALPNLLAERRIALYLTDPEKPLETSEELLQRMFGLTTAEARVTERLVAGWTLGEAAAQIGIQPSTARSYLKAIFRKTATTSQAALVGAVLSSPVWLGRRCKK